jgi:protein-S-isoprenylcysteine O-methyltransferase Ste14
MSSPSRGLMPRHSLQRLPSPSHGFSAIFHLLGVVSFSLSFNYLVEHPTLINESYGWHYQYLTIIGLTLALGTFIFGLLADITLSPKLFIIKNSLSLCSAPLEVLISVLYWGISAIDRELVVPPEIEVTPLADVGFHAIPAILLTFDLLFLSPPWTIRALPAMALSSALAGSYWVWIDHCYKQNGL